MATSLIVDFVNANGDTQRISWGSIDPSFSVTAVKQFVTGVVTNSSALLKVGLTSAKTATIRTTTDTAVDLSE